MRSLEKIVTPDSVRFLLEGSDFSIKNVKFCISFAKLIHRALQPSLCLETECIKN